MKRKKLIRVSRTTKQVTLPNTSSSLTTPVRSAKSTTGTTVLVCDYRVVSTTMKESTKRTVVQFLAGGLALFAVFSAVLIIDDPVAAVIGMTLTGIPAGLLISKAAGYYDGGPDVKDMALMMVSGGFLTLFITVGLSALGNANISVAVMAALIFGVPGWFVFRKARGRKKIEFGTGA